MAVLLILLTWAVVLGGITGLGLLAASIVARTASRRDRLQAGIWVGLTGLFVGSVVVGLLGPLTSTLGATTLALVVISGWAVLATATWRWAPAALRTLRATWSVRRIPALVVVALLGAAWPVVARFAAGAPMDGDTGLYRMGAITYAARFGTVPGLANLHDRFGFNTSTSPTAALLGNGLWVDQGFRLVVGLCLTALIASTVLRLLLPGRSRAEDTRADGPSAGDWFAVIGTAFTIAIVLTDTGRWVPSPASDLIVLVFGVAATTFLLDALTGRSVTLSAPTAVAVAAGAGSVRQLGWVSAAATVAVLAGWLWRSRREPVVRVVRILLPGVVVAAVALAAMLARDAILTGWLLYPSALAGLDVPWRTVPGTNTAEWITSWGRAPNVDKSIVLANNDWLGPWLTTFWQSRELRLNVYLSAGLVLPLLTASGRQAWRATLRTLPWAYLPTLLTAVAWFVTAPDVRFGWLAFAGLVAIPLALLLANGAYPPMALRVAGALVLVLMAASNVANGRVHPRGAAPEPVTLSWGPLSVTADLGPYGPAVLTPVTMHDGTPAWVAYDNQCWDTVPACLNADPSRLFRLGPDVVDGYATLDR